MYYSVMISENFNGPQEVTESSGKKCECIFVTGFKRFTLRPQQEATGSWVRAKTGKGGDDVLRG